MTRRSLLIKSLLFLTVAATSIWTAPPVQAAPETITIAASNTLRDTFRRILPVFESQNKDINIRIIYGTSQNLLKQIEEGAPIDVFLPSWFEDLEQLEKKGFIIQGTKTVYAGTSLALITGTEVPTLAVSAKDLPAAQFGISPLATRKLLRKEKWQLNFSHTANWNQRTGRRNLSMLNTQKPSRTW